MRYATENINAIYTKIAMQNLTQVNKLKLYEGHTNS